MIDQVKTTHPAQVYAQQLFRGVLANWVLDCARLHRKGLLRPCVRHAAGFPAAPARPRAAARAGYLEAPFGDRG